MTEERQEITEENKINLVLIKSDGFIPIKATPIEKLPLAKRIIQERANQISARQAFQKKLPVFETEADYYRHKAQAHNQLPDGSIVMGSLTELEKQTLRANNDVAIRKCIALREKTRQAARARRLEGKTQRDYFSGPC